MWEQGCGKTKPIIDTAAHLWDAGAITAMLVLAPNGVHSNWVHDEIPTHLSVEAKVLWWRSSRKDTKWFREEVEAFLKHPGFKILCMSYDAIMTDYGAKVARKLLVDNRCLMAIDESHRIKSPGAKRTMRVRAAGKYAPFRRIATGTIVDDTPFDVYSQLDFVQPGIWNQLGIQDAATFRAHFGVFAKGFNHATNQAFETVVGFRNLDQMKRVLDTIGSRLLKTQVLDLPPKLYSKFYFELSPAQARLYKQLAEDMRATFSDGASITADLAITRLLRFQQCVSGYLPADREEDLRPIEEDNPRIRALREVVEDVTGKFIVVGKYDIDVDSCADALRDDGMEVVTIDGRTSDEDRETAKKAFQKGSARVMVCKPMEGLTLHAASTMIFYDNGFHLRPRLQMEDRAHRIGQKDPVKYIDITAQGTIDERIIERLRKKQEMAATVQGDELRAWI